MMIMIIDTKINSFQWCEPCRGRWRGGYRLWGLLKEHSQDLADYRDTHDLAGHREEIKPAKFEVDIQSEVTYYAIERGLSEKIRAFAKHRGVSPGTLLNLWLQEKLREENA